MKKTILTYGLISGAVAAVLMFGTVTLAEKTSEHSEIIGYAGIILSFSLVFFGIKSYRDRIGNGSITFGKAFTIGILIALISSACYVIAWLIVYYNFYPDFMDQYAAHTIEKLKASGASQEKIDSTMKQMEQYKEMYKNPVMVAALTFLEPFPVGLIISLISALFLRKKNTEAAGA
jgi:hypothetical protein